MDRNELKNSLVARFDERWQNFWKKRQQYLAELESELRDLELTYGKPAVDQMFMFMRENGENSGFSRKVANPTSEKSSRSKRRRKRHQLAKKDQLNFTDTKEKVLAKLREMKPHSQFTSKDLRAELAKDGLKLVPDYVSVTLSQYVKGVKKVGVSPRASGGGPSLNLYEIQGKSLELLKKT